MMFKIGICDDEGIYIEAVRQEVENYFGVRAVIIQVYHTANEILIDEDKPDLLFLDIEMPELDGITLKNRLDEWGETVEIIFVTNYQQYMHEAFGRYVIAYLAKDEIQIMITIVLPGAI